MLSVALTFSVEKNHFPSLRADILGTDESFHNTCGRELQLCFGTVRRFCKSSQPVRFTPSFKNYSGWEMRFANLSGLLLFFFSILSFFPERKVFRKFLRDSISLMFRVRVKTALESFGYFSEMISMKIFKTTPLCIRRLFSI